MRTGRYSIAELFGNRHIGQLIIPEIQRDYVWEPKQVDPLLRSIFGNFEAWQREKVDPPWRVVPATATADAPSQSLQEDFAAFHARRTHATNIGFVYAYCDADLPGQYFLIDGQQRLTTLYLTLLALASRVPELKDRFRARYCLHSADLHGLEAAVPTKLDYKVREYTAEFLRQFVRYLLDGGAAAQLKDQGWCLERLSHDRTVKNLAGNFAAIQELLEPVLSGTEPSRLYEYLEELVECWYFDTNESAQGEELYLYLNARGESIAENENLKARLLSELKNLSEKDDWGRKWEEWQDYFWIHRTDGLSGKAVNPNADRGFNSFLRCVEYLERFRGDTLVTKSGVALETIEKYLRILHWLEQNREPFKEPYSYAAWVDEWSSEIWQMFNRPDAVDWTASPGDNSKSTEHNSMVLVWGSLLCVICALEKRRDNWDDLDREQIFRAIRIFYLRFRNFGRAVAALPKTVKGVMDDDPGVLGGDEDATEERARWDFLKERPAEECREFESVIWKIEDHPLNRNGGRGLGGTNLTHLVDLSPAQPPTLAQLEMVRDVFYELFPAEEGPATDKKKRVASVLLYYGPFWNRVSPWYYENYEFGDWPRTIRGRGSEETRGAEGTVFRRFFDDFLRTGQTLDTFADSKKASEPVDPQSEKDLRRALIWYSEAVGTRFLEKGMHVAKTYEERDAHFPELPTLWNTKGDFKGARGNRKLGDLIEMQSSE